MAHNMGEAIDALTLEDNDTNVIGRVNVRGEDGSERLVDITVDNATADEAQAEFCRQIFRDTIALTTDRGPDQPDVLATLYTNLRTTVDRYANYSGSMPITVRVGDRYITGGEQEGERQRIADLRLNAADLTSARTVLMQHFACDDDEATGALQEIFQNLTHPAIIGVAPTAPAITGPATMHQVVMTDSLTTVTMGLDASHSAAQCMVIKKTFATDLRKLSYPTPEEGGHIDNGTAAKPWDDNMTVVATDLIFDLHGSIGIKQLGSYIAGVINNREYAGIQTGLVAFSKARRYRHLEVVAWYLQAKALTPKSATDDRPQKAITSVVDAYNFTRMHDLYHHIVAGLSHDDNGLRNAVAAVTPRDATPFTDMRVAAKHLLANLAGQSISSCTADLQLAQSYAAIRDVAPYLLLCIGTGAHKSIRTLGPHRVRSVVRRFVENQGVFCDVMNKLDAFTDAVEVFVRQDMTAPDWNPIPLQLPPGVDTVVNTSVTRINQQWNTVERVIDALVDQVRME